MFLPHRVDSISPSSLSSMKMMDADFLAISVPYFPKENPISAFLRAFPSLLPSPT